MTRRLSNSTTKRTDTKRVNTSTVRKTSEIRNQFQFLLHSLRGKFKGKDLLRALEVQKQKARAIK